MVKTQALKQEDTDGEYIQTEYKLKILMANI